jgi:hypothetical protein
VCFFSNIIKTIRVRENFKRFILLILILKKKKIKIAIKDIIEVEKLKTAFFVPNAILIKTKSEDYQFSALNQRQACYDLILKLMNDTKKSNTLEAPVISEKPAGDLNMNQIMTESASPITKQGSNENIASPNLMESKEAKVETEKPSDDADVTDDDMNSLNPKIDCELIYTDEFPMSISKFFDTFISNEAKIPITEFHKFRNDRSIKLSKWAKDETLGFSRELSFESDIKDAPIFSPKQAQVHRVQRYKMDKKRLLIDSETVTVDVPYGDSFRLIEKWDITNVKSENMNEEESNRCKLEVYFGVIFSKSLFGMMKSAISSVSRKEYTENAKKWADFAMKTYNTQNEVPGSVNQAFNSSSEPSKRSVPPSPPNIKKQVSNSSLRKTSSHFFEKNLKFLFSTPLLLILLLLSNVLLFVRIQNLERQSSEMNNTLQTNDRILFSLYLDAKHPLSEKEENNGNLLDAYWQLRNDLKNLEVLLSQQNDKGRFREDTLLQISRLSKHADISLSKLYLESVSTTSKEGANKTP